MFPSCLPDTGGHICAEAWSRWLGQELESEFTELMVYQRSDEEDAEDLSGQPTTESAGGTERQRVEDREPLPGFERVTPEQQQEAGAQPEKPEENIIKRW